MHITTGLAHKEYAALMRAQICPSNCVWSIRHLFYLRLSSMYVFMNMYVYIYIFIIAAFFLGPTNYV